jgi:hypothetical protein
MVIYRQCLGLKLDSWFLFITWLFGLVWDQSGGESSVGGKTPIIEISLFNQGFIFSRIDLVRTYQNPRII